MLLIQMLILALVIGVVVSVLRRFFRHELSLGAAVGWLVSWFAIAVVVVLPRTTEFLARILGVGRGADAVVYLSVVTLFYLHFRVLVRLEKMDHTITQMVRTVALKDIDTQK